MRLNSIPQRYDYKVQREEKVIKEDEHKKKDNQSDSSEKEEEKTHYNVMNGNDENDSALESAIYFVGNKPDIEMIEVPASDS
jgi:hypothetical protein